MSEQRSRRPGDDPFLSDDGFFWWLPKAIGMGLLLLVAILAIVSTVHHGRWRLVTDDDGAAVLEQGRWAPFGWQKQVPDGAVDAWTPVPWPADAAQAPLSGELRPLAENFHAFLRSEAATAPSSASERLAQLEAQAGAFEDWYRRRWNGESPPGSGSIAQRRQALAAERAAAEEAARRAAAEAARKADEERRRAEEAARKALEAQLAWTARRRDLLEEAEALLASLPPPTQTSAEQERDRVALKAFIASMDTPLGGVPRPAPATPAPASNAPASTPSASPSPPSPPPGTPPR